VTRLRDVTKSDSVTSCDTDNKQCCEQW